MSHLDRAKEILKNNSYTCVVCKSDKTFTSTDRGVKPLVLWHESGEDMKNGSAADKVVGRGAAFLYLLLGIRELYAHVISKPALELLSKNGVDVSYGILADNIINRHGNGICPFEAAVLDITDPREAYIAITQKMKEMNIR
ncbi:MAG: DUF1893 domain-containing protein [Ruminococcaceae bacterium]|nr:DUF1893 domain-containing protein [Oscillospiraceae bacterium]